MRKIHSSRTMGGMRLFLPTINFHLFKHEADSCQPGCGSVINSQCKTAVVYGELRSLREGAGHEQQLGIAIIYKAPFLQEKNSMPKPGQTGNSHPTPRTEQEAAQNYAGRIASGQHALFLFTVQGAYSKKVSNQLYGKILSCCAKMHNKNSLFYANVFKLRIL